jgi:hypothetical protein
MRAHVGVALGEVTPERAGLPPRRRPGGDADHHQRGDGKRVAITGPVASLIGARETLALSGGLGAATFFFLFIPGLRDPEKQPLRA